MIYCLQIYNPSVMDEPPVPKARRSIKDIEEHYFNNHLHRLHEMKGTRQQKNSHLSKSKEYDSNESESEKLSFDDSIELENEKLSFDGSIERKKQVKKQKDQNDKKECCPQHRSRTPKKYNAPRVQPPKKQDVNMKHYLIIPIIFSVIIFLLLPNMYKTQQPIINHLSLPEFIESVKAKFHNQESDSWNDISSAINEVTSRTPKVPSIILLFSNETNTMDCLATKVANISSIMLHTDQPKNFNPEDFGDDAGNIINTVKQNFPQVKVMVSVHVIHICCI